MGRFGFSDDSSISTHPKRIFKAPIVAFPLPPQQQRVDCLDSDDTWRGEITNQRIVLSPKKQDEPRRPTVKSSHHPPPTQSSIVKIIKDKNFLLNVDDIVKQSRSVDEDDQNQQILIQQQQQNKLDAAKKQKEIAAVKLETERAEKIKAEQLLKAQAEAAAAIPTAAPPQQAPTAAIHHQHEKEAAVFIDEVNRIKTQVKPGLKADKAAKKAFFDRKVVINTR
jgi:hypothetical protein